MKIHLLNPLRFLVLLIALTLPWALQGQTTLTLPTSGTAGNGSTAVDFEFRLDGTIIEKGIGSTPTLTTTELQSSSLFLWYPALHALRAGGNSLDTVATIGPYSTAFGIYSSASGPYSFAAGNYGTASGANSVSFGGYASGTDSFAFFGSAWGVNSIALGNGNVAGPRSTAIGNNTWASGTQGVAIGIDSSAYGTNSIAIGYEAQEGSYGAIALGSYITGCSENGGSVNSTSWVSTDPLLEVGNGTGTGSTPRSDALVVYKNGNAVFSPPPGTSSCTVAAPVFLTTTPGGSGDIPMYTGN